MNALARLRLVRAQQRAFERLVDLLGIQARATLMGQVTSLRSQASQAWLLAFSSLTAVPERIELLNWIGRALEWFAGIEDPELTTKLYGGTSESWFLGRTHGIAQIHQRIELPERSLPREITRKIRDAPKIIANARSHAEAVLQHLPLEQAQPWFGIDAALSEVEALPRIAETIANDLATESYSRGIEDVADHVNYHRVWLAERDACLICSAFAGQVAKPGESFHFDRARYFGNINRLRNIDLNPMRPDIHPHGRCITSIVNMSNADDREFVERIGEEALRSIYRGFSLPSESQRARLLAAGRLLDSGETALPRSVAAYAERAVREGRFPRGKARLNQ